MAYERSNVSTTVWRRAPSHLGQHVRVDDACLSLDGVLWRRRDEIRGVRLALDERATVLVSTHAVDRRRMFLAPPDGVEARFSFSKLEDAEAFVDALGFPSESVAREVELEPSLVSGTFQVLAPKRGLLLAFGTLLAALAIMLLAPRVTSAIILLAPLIGFTSGAVRSRQRILTIGADGLHARGLYGSEFLLYTHVAAVRERADGLVLESKKGGEVKLALKHVARAPEVVARIQRRLATRADADAGAARLVRSVGGEGAAKVAALRELGDEGRADYRSASLPRERLVRVVEDPAIDPKTRIDAAIALSRNPAAREQLRVAASATANPHVRVALEAIASEVDDDRLATALRASSS